MIIEVIMIFVFCFSLVSLNQTKLNEDKQQEEFARLRYLLIYSLSEIFSD